MQLFCDNFILQSSQQRLQQYLRKLVSAVGRVKDLWTKCAAYWYRFICHCFEAAESVIVYYCIFLIFYLFLLSHFFYRISILLLIKFLKYQDNVDIQIYKLTSWDELVRVPSIHWFSTYSGFLKLSMFVWPNPNLWKRTFFLS